MKELNKSFYKFRITFNGNGGRLFQEGVINEPISKDDALNMLIKNYGGSNNERVVKVSYLIKQKIKIARKDEESSGKAQKINDGGQLRMTVVRKKE